ncbi:MAG TPA: heme ABC exporter ATP-binding protein CcmA [Gemmatimonadales bacterium]|jgi:heme ABC exporter ATP-binding subunit CcmA
MPPYENSGDAVAVLAARGLTRAFGRVTVLRDVDLTLAPGEAVAVAGPNGAGKTTLLRLLAGLLRPTRGDVTILGQRLQGDHSVRRNIGFLSHQSLLYDDLTVLENLTFAARLYGVPHPANAARAALDAAGLSARAGDSPGRLSRGLLQRAALARALLHRPRILLLDEPFTALDEPSAARLRETLRSVLAGGGALVLVTHHLAEVWDLATRVAVMVGGKWRCDEAVGGTAAEFIPRYQAMADA